MSSILGKGLDFPFDTERGKLKTASGAGSVEAAMAMLFETRRGARFMLPAYGSDVPLLLFEPCDKNTALLAKAYIEEAIREWIPRVQVIGVQADPILEQSMIRVRVNYRLVTDPNPRMMIYPLYVQQG